MLLFFVLSCNLGFSLSLNDSVNLVALDIRLTKLLVQPEPGKGNELLYDSEFMNKELDEVSDLVFEKDLNGSIAYNKIAKAGGLKFINTTYNPELLKKGYSFSEDDLMHLQTNIKEMKSIWKCIEVMLNISLPDSGEHFRENMLAHIRERELLRGDVIKDELSPFGTSELYDDSEEQRNSTRVLFQTKT